MSALSEVTSFLAHARLWTQMITVDLLITWFVAMVLTLVFALIGTYKTFTVSF